MLLNITIENFRSYNEPQTLSLIANSANEINAVKIKNFMVRKSAVIYGANASGKSNIIKAIVALIDILMNDLNPTSPSGIYSPFFKSSQPTTISIDFSVLEQIYTYTLSYDNKNICLEELQDEKEQLIFLRRLIKGEYEYLIPESAYKLILSDEQLEVADGLLKQIRLSTTSKRLFLRQLVENNCKQLQNVKDSIQNIILRQNPYDYIGKPYTAYSDLNFAANYFERNHKEIDIIKALNGIGVNINNLKVIYNNENPQVGDIFGGVKKLLSRYNIDGKEYELDFKEDESDGTVKFYNYFALINFIIQSDGILIVDELETHFHPLLVEEIIHAIHRSHSRAQLIFTTHNPVLLNDDIFERDQIYFAAKNESQATELYSLADFTDLKEANDIQAKYMTGKFGGIPYFHSLNFDGEK
ncbi:MAG: AAA family ATPase [Burkholderiales bacterium]|nr:AAA family ATPase [Burkholderiales bacterium]